MIHPIRMETIKDVQKVSEEAAQSGLELSVTCGNVIIDPRSILALYTLMGKDALLVAEDNTNPKAFMRLVKRMGVTA